MTKKKVVFEPFSKVHDDVFLIKTDIVSAGALMSRYSRSNKSMKDVYKDEFENNENRGKEFYEKVFNEYGDDSIAEMIHISMGIEGISNIVSVLLEDIRIGLSFIEKSTRYIDFSKSECYNSDRELDPISEVNQFALDTFQDILPKFIEYFIKKYPFKASGYESEKAYANSIKAKALDHVRVILPNSIKTNLGISGNARAFINLIEYLSYIPMGECQNLKNKILEIVSSDDRLEILFRRVKSKLESVVNNSEYYLNQVYKDPALVLGARVQSNNRDIINSDISLVHFDFPIAYLQLVNNCYQNINNISNERLTRRDKLPKEFELFRADFSIMSTYGTFRDIHRHRMLTMLRPMVTNNLKYYNGDKLFYELNVLSKINNVYQEFDNIFEQKKGNGIHFVVNQYATLMGNIYEYLIKTDFKQCCYMIELRTGPQGHFEYRKIFQDMYYILANNITKPFLDLIKFVDLRDEDSIGLGRYSSEVKKEDKLKLLEQEKKND